MMTFNLMKCAALALLAVFASGSQAFACNSGPDFCTDDSRIPSALVAKKQALKKQGYPDRLVSMIDRGVQCVARIREEPDGFHVIDVGTDGSKNDLSWDADEERIAKGNLTSGASVRSGSSTCGTPSNATVKNLSTNSRITTQPRTSTRMERSNVNCKAAQ